MKKKLLEKVKNNKFDIISIVGLIITYIVLVLIVSRGGKYALISTTDFKAQHYLIPDYFRKLFYDTHNLFPNFAFNLGAGENIYYLSYYGLFNPLIMFSYCLPMVKMIDYIQIMMSIVVLSSVILFYFYLRKNKYSYLISFICSFMFLCSSSFFFHSHRHIMFINYMPFLIMGLYGIDRYIEKNKSDLLIISMALMILTSYYFSISGLLVLFTYSIYKYIKNNKNIKFKKVFNFGLKIIPRFLASVLTSCILILPTFYTLINGRTSDKSLLDIKEIIKPNMYLLYNNYSIGLTLISLIAIIYMIIKGKKANRLLSIIILIISVFPIFVFILNGFLYVNSKVLIPFIPLVLILISEFLVIVFKNKKAKVLIPIYIIISSVTVCLVFSLFDQLVLKEDINKNINKNYDEIIKNTISKDELYRTNSSLLGQDYINRVGNINEYKTTLYSSTHNKNYQDFYNKIFHNSLLYRNKFMLTSSNNVLFQIFMGEKYLITNKHYKRIYKKINQVDYTNIYKNNYVLPIGYATDKVINNKDFDNLSHSEKIINMLGKVIVNSKTNTDFIHIDNTVNYHITGSKNITIKKKADRYKIVSKEDGLLYIDVDSNMNNKLLFISFDLLDNESCNIRDLSIKINDVRNTLTCKKWKYYNNNKNFNYTLIRNKKLKVKFSEGEYDIANIKVNSIDFDKIKDINKEIDPFIIDNKLTKGDIIEGSIDVSKDSYFTISIPYDKGFNIYVDNKLTKYKKVNKSFIGFKISKGKHNIKIKYRAPFRDISLIISLLGIILSVIICVKERRK